MSTWLVLPSCQKANSTLILEEKDAENTKKATKVTLNIFRGYLQKKRIEGSRTFDIKG